MSVSIPTTIVNVRTRQIIRYAFGSVIAMAVAMIGDWTVAYLTPVLILMFIGSPTPCPSFKQGIGFIAVIVVASIFGVILMRYVVPYPLIFVPLAFILMLNIFYAEPKTLPPLLKLFMLMTLSSIPLLGLQSPIAAVGFAWALVGNGIATVVLTWLIYAILPDSHKARQIEDSAAKPQLPTQQQRFRTALVSTIVVYPMFLAFYFFEWVSMLIVLIFAMILTMQPGFAKNFKAGILLVLANAVGGMAAVIVFELLVIVPVLSYMLMLVGLVGLILGARLFSERPAAALYGTAFSTFLVIIGSTTSGQSEADAKAYSRVFQIMLSVVYVVVASGSVTALLTALLPKLDKSD